MSTLGIAGVVAAVPALDLAHDRFLLLHYLQVSVRFSVLAITADVVNEVRRIVRLLRIREERERRTTYGNRPVKEASSASLKEEIKDGLSKKGPPLFSWKVAAVSIALFAAFGALIACHPASASLVLDKGISGAGLLPGSKVRSLPAPSSACSAQRDWPEKCR